MHLLSITDGRTVYDVQLARHQRADEANHLVSQRYAGRGYNCSDQVPSSSRHTLVVTGGAYDSTLATLTIADGTYDALPAERLFADEIGHMRREDNRISEYTRFASVAELRSSQVIAALFQTALYFSRVVVGASRIICEVNPRHVSFYRRNLGFVPAGAEKHDASVGAPGVLLGQGTDQLHRWTEEVPDPTRPRYYRNALPPMEKQRLANSLSTVVASIAVA